MVTARDGASWAPRLHAVETPEQVVLELELAGVGSRLAAALLDLLVVSLIVIGLIIASTLTFAGAGTTWLVALILLLTFAVTWGYFMLCEALLDGRTLGKKWLGIRVVMDTGHRVTFGAAAIRNLVRMLDLQPGMSYFIGALFVFFHSKHKRLGDIVAGTIVVRDRPAEAPLVAAAPPPLPAATAAERAHQAEAGAPLLADDEFRLLGQFLARRDALDALARRKLASGLAARLAEHRAGRPASPESFLADLHADEQRRRSSRLAAARGKGGQRSAAAARFAALKQSRWDQFRQDALAAERHGLTASGSALTRFAARYREVAADLARARTYGADPPLLAYLERIVSAGHNALYGLRGVRRVALWPLVLRGLPAAVMRARGYVLAAFLMFAVPATLGFVLIRTNPAIAERVLPDEILARAASGARHRASGVGYAETPSAFLPIMASRIIANNVQVAIAAFAGGITAGVATAAVLVFNGLFFGAIMGLFMNHGVADWLLTFVAGHGVLELTAIFVAGGAGLLVARALIAPGDWSRSDAIVVYGRLAIQLVAAAALLLLLAGTIEGLLSASDAPPVFKLGVSAASAVLLGLLAIAGLRNGRDERNQAPDAPGSTMRS